MAVYGLRASAFSAADGMNKKAGKSAANKLDPQTLVIIFMAVVCAFLPLDISQLTFAILGAVLYALLQKHDKLAPKKASLPTMKCLPADKAPATKQKAYPKQKVLARPVDTKSHSEAKPDVRLASIVPVLAPTFQSKGWEGETQELATQITPTAEVEEIVRQIAQLMKRSITDAVPEVEVLGFAHGNLSAGKAFGVAVPEVDIVATVNPHVLFSRLQAQKGQAHLDVKKLQKIAIRVFTDRLVSSGFKFRRSAFRGQEPKVTLLAPASLGLFVDAIPIDFSVNVVTPLYNASLLTECGMMDVRAKELILLVKRWAKDRGICHAAKGHLSPYLWGLLSMYFLQVGDREEGPLLPSLEHFDKTSDLAAQLGNRRVSTATTTTQSKWKSSQTQGPNIKSVGALFKDFFRFFHAEFDWCNEAVSLYASRCAASALHLPHDSHTPQVGPSIEDPFQAKQNLGDCMNALSFARLKEELARAEAMCAKDASLSELLEPWAPPEAETQIEIGHEDEEQSASKESTPRREVEKLSEKIGSGAPWRREAAHAQASRAVATPPWRR